MGSACMHLTFHRFQCVIAWPSPSHKAEWMGRVQAGSLASNICQARPAGQPLTLKLELGHREPLAGQELEAFYASRAAHAVEEDEPQPSLTPRYNPLPGFLVFGTLMACIFAECGVCI